MNTREKRITTIVISEVFGFFALLMGFFIGVTLEPSEEFTTIWGLVSVIPNWLTMTIYYGITHVIPRYCFPDLLVFPLLFLIQFAVYAVLGWIIARLKFRDK